MGRQAGLPDLVVVHRDAAAARATIERLSLAGLDGGAIELLGHVEVVTAGRYGDRQVDRGSAVALGTRLLRGIAWGAPLGALFGTVLVAVATRPGWEAILPGAAVGVVFGAAVGMLTAVLAIPTMASSWERTFAPMVPGGVVVGVRVEDRRALRRADRALADRREADVHEIGDLDDLPDAPPDLHALDE